ncbi:MAG TPA: hypothetical protein VK742_01675 [Candidatus Sulfotelmatobacter sp.]|jgi:hypothetical protein|nr:hypothetical protein [Candidatus Sulfotelmatobacter sp.]
MNSSHATALRSFARHLQWLLTLRLTVQFATVWFFVWGVVVLAFRFFGGKDNPWFMLGILGLIPLVIFAAWSAHRQQPAFARMRANYDRLNQCGGILMAEETADMAAWFGQLPEAAVPKFHWHSGRAMLLLFISASFTATALLLPEKLARFGHRPLEIGQIVQQLQAEVKTLTQEKILDDKKSDDLQKQLSELQKDSSGYDPNKTWEALDHIKQADSDAAKTAAEEAIQKTESLTEAETLAKAMDQAAEQGMDNSTAAQAAQDLASLMNSAKLEEGVLNGQIPPELLQSLAGTNGLNPEQMQKLLSALEANKGNFNSMMTNLANLKLIDPATLAKCQNAGHNPDFAGLALYLSQCQGGKCDSQELFTWLHKRCRGGPGGGGPEAPMDWDNDTSEANLKFQEHTLPPSSHIEDAQMVGVSKSAPELAKDDVTAQHGALDNAQAGGGSGHAQVILPEHRQAVQNFFKRDEK